jgi:hypothetical protein
MNQHTSNTFVYLNEFGDALRVERQPHEQSLAFFQTLVDGLITVVSSPMFDFVCNDEGLFRQDFGINLVASLLSKRQLVGPCVISKTDRDGNSIGLTEADIRSLDLFMDDRIWKSHEVAEKMAASRAL